MLVYIVHDLHGRVYGVYASFTKAKIARSGAQDRKRALGLHDADKVFIVARKVHK